MSEEAGYSISFNEFFKAGFPVMILTTFIVSLYMLLVFIVGGEDNAIYVKLILVGITTLSIIGQLVRSQQRQNLRRGAGRRRDGWHRRDGR